MRKAMILYKDQEAGVLAQQDDGSFMFQYTDVWIQNPACPAISPTLPKSSKEHYSPFLFPFFYNMLPEGSNKLIVCKHLRIDPDDHFSLLMATAANDSIGAITVKKIKEAS